MQWERLGVDRRHGSIVLVVFRRVGFGIGKLQNFELVGVVEKHHWLCDCVDISLRNLVNFLQFADVSCEVQRVGRASGQVFSQIDII